MKCPKCEYHDGWEPESMDVVHGDSGAFYNMGTNIAARESLYSHRDEIKTVYFCPKCGTGFIDV